MCTALLPNIPAKVNPLRLEKESRSHRAASRLCCCGAAAGLAFTRDVRTWRHGSAHGPQAPWGGAAGRAGVPIDVGPLSTKILFAL